jgi:hypothetical protein
MSRDRVTAKDIEAEFSGTDVTGFVFREQHRLLAEPSSSLCVVDRDIPHPIVRRLFGPPRPNPKRADRCAIMFDGENEMAGRRLSVLECPLICSSAARVAVSMSSPDATRSLMYSP